jgi:hypothetical protein
MDAPSASRPVVIHCTTCFSSPPFTRRAYQKPRGYAGDAVLMDLIYGMARPGDDLSPLGGMLYGYEFDSPCFQSVRTRRAILAREIDSIAVARPDARVLSVASGHLREIEWSRAARSGAVEITAIDQDRDSLGCIARDYQRYRVSTVPATIGDLLRRSVRFADVDLAYAAGLYDYLDDDLARALTATLFRHASVGRTTADRQLHAGNTRRSLHGNVHGLAPRVSHARSGPNAGVVHRPGGGRRH